MKSPRHRWIWVAQQENKAYQKDGLFAMATPDDLAKDLRKVVAGKGGPKRMARAYEYFQAPSSRYPIEGVLFATGSIEKTAKILGMDSDVAMMQIYADCFFDITVFGNEADKALYLDKYGRVDIAGAQMMRNIMSQPAEQLEFLVQKSSERVSPKEALEQGLTYFHNMMRVYAMAHAQLETIMISDLSEQQLERSERLLKYAAMCASQVRGFTDQILKYELDKNADNFLSAFSTALISKPIKDLVQPKLSVADGGPELI